MDIEKLTTEDWQWLVGKIEICQSFGVDFYKETEEMIKELSQKAYGGKFKHSPSVIENREQNGRLVYVLFGDLVDEPMCILREED